MTTKPSQRPHAVVTGASSGIGKAFSERLAREGYDLTIVARRRDRLEALAKSIIKETGAGLDILVADLSQAADVHALEKRLAENDSLEMLVNNAGFADHMPFIQLEPAKAEEVIMVQVLAVTRLTHAALPGMLARHKGAIINVSSRLAFSGPVNIPRMAPTATYAGTKAFINTFTQILSREVAGSGVQVQALCPAVVLTEFHLRQGIDPKRFPPDIISTPEDVVQASLVGLELGEVICLPGMEDPAPFQKLEEQQRAFFEESGAGGLASRYKSKGKP